MFLQRFFLFVSRLLSRQLGNAVICANGLRLAASPFVAVPWVLRVTANKSSSRHPGAPPCHRRALVRSGTGID